MFLSLWYCRIHFFLFYVCKVKVKLATLVEGDLKAPFPIATTPSCWGRRNSIPWFAPLYPRSLPHSAECKARHDSTHDKVWLNVRLNPGIRDHWRTLYSLGHLLSRDLINWHIDWQQQNFNPFGVILCKEIGEFVHYSIILKSFCSFLILFSHVF